MPAGLPGRARTAECMSRAQQSLEAPCSHDTYRVEVKVHHKLVSNHVTDSKTQCSSVQKAENICLYTSAKFVKCHVRLQNYF